MEGGRLPEERPQDEIRESASGDRGRLFWECCWWWFSPNDDKASLAFKKGHVGKVVESYPTRFGEFLSAFHTLLLPSDGAQFSASL